MNLTLSSVASAFSLAVLLAAAHLPDAVLAAPSGDSAGQAELPWVDGEVEDVDPENQWVVVRHGPIPNLNMDAMTMAFSVKDQAMLSGLKVGDRIRFTAISEGENPTITSFKAAR